MGALDKQAELIRGVIVRKMPKSPLQCKLIKRISSSCLPFSGKAWSFFPNAHFVCWIPCQNLT